MGQAVKSIKGVHDVLPDDVHLWHFLESVVREVTSSYGYREIRTPILEKTELFKRSIGDVTDIVEKEMYCLLYTSPSPRDATLSRMPSSA